MGVARLSLAVALWALLGTSADGLAQRGLVLMPGSGGESRVALVVGNSAYQDSPLRNPVNDATDMAAALRGLGFDVDLRTDATRADMKTALREFAQSLREGGVGLFYYAGHGVQSRGRNFLIPVDASIQSEAELEYESVDANLVLAYMDEARTRVNIVVLDACRNNPFARSFRSASRGLVQMEAGRGTFIAFATAPGSVAADGDGRNGLYTQHLLESLKHRVTDIDKVFRRVTAEVAQATGGEQVPWVSTSLTGDFHFRPSPQLAAANTPPAAGTPAPIAPAMELAFWETIKESRNPADFREYLVQYPTGRFAGLARNRLESSQSRVPQVAMAAPSRAALEADPSTVAQPSLKIGDRWIMRVFDALDQEEKKTYEERVTEMSGELLTMVQTTLSAGAPEEEVGRRSIFTVEAATWTTRARRMVEGDNMAIAFPLHVGKKWQYSFKFKNQKGEVLTHDRKAEVTGWEEVRVPAGVFRALKIVHAGNRLDARNNQRGSERNTFWYAPDMKRWVRRQNLVHSAKGERTEERVIELVRAELQP